MSERRCADLTADEGQELMGWLHGILIERSERGPRPGSKGWSDLYHARWAAAYDLLCRAGSDNPVNELSRYINALHAELLESQGAGRPA